MLWELKVGFADRLGLDSRPSATKRSIAKHVMQSLMWEPASSFVALLQKFTSRFIITKQIKQLEEGRLTSNSEIEMDSVVMQPKYFENATDNHLVRLQMFG